MSGLSHNLKLSYLYRDAGNFKIFEQAVLANPEALDIKWVEEQIVNNLIDGEYFVPEQWGLRRPQFPDYDPELDHEWCEFEKIAYSEDQADLEIATFLKKLRV